MEQLAVRALGLRAVAVGAVAVLLASGLGVQPLATTAAQAGSAIPACPEVLAQGPLVDRVAGPDRYATAACASAAAYPTSSGGAVVLARGDAAGGLADALAGTVLAHALAAPVLLVAPDVLPEPTRAELLRLAALDVVVLGGSAAVGDRVVAEVEALLPDAAVSRVAGPDRYGTAAAASAAAGSGRTAFVVNGFRPADALLAAAPAARAGARLLLASPTDVPAATRAALADVTDVVVVGGYGVVTEQVEADLAAIVGTGHVRRVSGGDRAETAASLARAFPVPGRLHLVGAADPNLVDAIAAGWSAALPGGGAVLFSGREDLGHGTERYLRLGGLTGVEAIRLVGGTSTLSDGLLAVLRDRVAEAAAGGPPPELRGVWAHLFDGSLKSPRGIEAFLDAAAAANLNTVVVQVARRQDAYYTSSVLPRTPDPSMPADLDLLGRLVPAARDRGLDVQAWIAVLPAWHDVYAGLSLPVWEAHGAGSGDPWVSVTNDGVQGTMLDPGVPAVVAHAAAVASEIASRYAVTAVHLDYVRYESEAWGYHPTSLARFRESYGLPPAFVPATDDPRWDEWRRRATHDLALAIRDAVRAVAPGVAVTMAASTMGEPPRAGLDYANTRTWQDVFQAWPDWLHAGVIDAAFPMNYFRETSHAAWFDAWVAFGGLVDDWCEQARPSCVVATGQAAYLNTVDASLSQIAQARATTDGAVVYSYQLDSIDEPAGTLLDALPSTTFTTPAPAPTLTD